MLELNVTVEIHCQRPLWAIHKSKYNQSRYRICINDDLITERDWIWENNIFLNENIWIYADNNKDYQLNVTPILYIPEQAQFKISNLKTLNIPAKINQIDDLTVSFKL